MIRRHPLSSFLARLAFGAAILVLGPSPAIPAEMLEGPFNARVLEVIDGDSLRVVVRVWLDQHIETLVRIRGIDTPERRGACPEERAGAAAAAEALNRLIGPGPVVLSRIAGDKFFGRVLADVRSDEGVAIADAMLHSGLARAYSGSTRKGWCGPNRPKLGKTVVEKDRWRSFDSR